jgi:uncharacterized protein YdaU (DUF1376 family)
MSENRGVSKEAGRERVGSTTHDPDQSPNEEVHVAPAKSTKAPAFQFFPRDFLSSPKVDRMQMTERGAYITLLCRCWLDNGLPTDLSELAHYCRMKPAQFERLWKSGKIRECFHERGGKLHNERLDAERKKQAAYYQRQSENARAKWHSRGTTTAMPPHSQQQASGNTRAITRVADAEADRKQQIAKSVLEGGPGETLPAMDSWFSELHAAYPPQSRTSGYITEQAFVAALTEDGRPPSDVFAEMLANLDNQKRGYQWRVKRYIPNLDNWLRGGKWKQQHDASPPTALVSEKTLHTAIAADAFEKGGKHEPH